MKLDNAEDLWLVCVMQAPTYAEHSLVTEEHLSPRARNILAAIKDVVEQGWPMVAPEQVQTHEDLRTIPRRMDSVDAPSTIAAAERELIKAWAASQYRAALLEAAELAQTEGREAAQAHVQDAEQRLQAHSSGLHWRSAGEAARSFISRLRRRMNDDGSDVLGSGFEAIDRAVRNWKPKRMTVLGGYTNEWKSTLALQLLTGIALTEMENPKRSGIVGALISMEDEEEIPASRQLAMLTEVIEAVVRMDNDEVTPADLQLLEQVATDTLDDLPMDIVYAAGWGVDRVCYAIQDAARRGARVVVVDYLQCFETSADRRVELANFARRMKAAAVSVGVHLILVSQLVRPKDGSPRKARPSMFQFKESGDIENITENAILVWRPQKDKDLSVERAQAIIDKVKDGRPGTVDLGFDVERHMFTLEPPDEAATGQREIGGGGY